MGDVVHKGDRVLWPGYDYGKGASAPDRLGYVVEEYEGTASCNDYREQFVAIRFDTGRVERGFLNNGKMLQKVGRL